LGGTFYELLLLLLGVTTTPLSSAGHGCLPWMMTKMLAVWVALQASTPRQIRLSKDHVAE